MNAGHRKLQGHSPARAMTLLGMAVHVAGLARGADRHRLPGTRTGYAVRGAGRGPLVGVDLKL